MYAHMHTLIHIVILFILQSLCYFCAHSTMYTVRLRACAMRGQVKELVPVRACLLRAIGKLARKAACDRGSYAS